MKRTQFLTMAGLLMFPVAMAQQSDLKINPVGLTNKSNASQRYFNPQFFPSIVSFYSFSNNDWNLDRVDRLVEILNPQNKIIEQDYVNGDDFRITDHTDLSVRGSTHLIEIKRGGTGDYQNFERVRQENDLHGHHSLYVVESWINDLWTTLYGNKFSNDYLNGKVTNTVVSEFNNTTGEYEKKDQYSYEYQEDGKTSQMIVDKYAADAWEHLQKYQYQYDDIGRAKKVAIFSWDEEDWFFGLYLEYDYYADGVLTVTHYSLNGDSEVALFRKTYQIDEHDNTILDLTEVPDGSGGWEKTSGTKHTLTYAQQLLLEHIKQEYRKSVPGAQTGGDNWENVLKEVYSDYVSVGVESITNQNSFQIYPNPASNYLTIESLSPTPIEGSLWILDATGKIVTFQEIPPGLMQLTVDCSGWVSGTYLVCWKNKLTSLSFRKVLIQK